MLPSSEREPYSSKGHCNLMQTVLEDYISRNFWGIAKGFLRPLTNSAIVTLFLCLKIFFVLFTVIVDTFKCMCVDISIVPFRNLTKAHVATIIEHGQLQRKCRCSLSVKMAAC